MAGIQNQNMAGLWFFTNLIGYIPQKQYHDSPETSENGDSASRNWPGHPAPPHSVCTEVTGGATVAAATTKRQLWAVWSAGALPLCVGVAHGKTQDEVQDSDGWCG